MMNSTINGRIENNMLNPNPVMTSDILGEKDNCFRFRVVLGDENINVDDDDTLLSSSSSQSSECA